MNTVQILGNLTRDVQLGRTNGGKPVANLTVAVNRQIQTATGETRELTDYITVVAWERLAEAAAQLKKGTRVFVEGRYTTRPYETPDGQKRTATEVTAGLIAIPIRTPEGRGETRFRQEEAIPF